MAAQHGSAETQLQAVAAWTALETWWGHNARPDTGERKPDACARTGDAAAAAEGNLSGRRSTPSNESCIHAGREERRRVWVRSVVGGASPCFIGCGTAHNDRHSVQTQ